MKTNLSKEFSLKQISSDVSSWLLSLNENLDPGRFRFCDLGSKVPESGIEGQMATCFAMKSAWIIGAWENWDLRQKKGAINFVKSFQNSSGFFIDPWLKKSCRPNILESMRNFIKTRNSYYLRRIYKYKHLANINAETRQACSTLLMVKSIPKFPLPSKIRNKKTLYNFLESLDWSDPWHANSQVSHQIMMLSVNKCKFRKKKNYKIIIREILNYYQNFFETKTGTWQKNNNLDKQIKLNGAMKFYSGIQWIDGLNIRNKQLIDFALGIPVQFDGCNFTNSLFAIYFASKGIEEYRKDEIIDRCIKCLNHTLSHKIKGSGFSFHLNACQKGYYTREVSTGLEQADLHGTAMFLLGISLALSLMGNHAPKDAEKWQLFKA